MLVSNVENLETPLTSIQRVALPDYELSGREASIAESMGVDRLIVSPNVWMANPQSQPEASAALGGIAKIAGGRVHSSRLYEGTGISVTGDARHTTGLAFIGHPEMVTRRQLEDVRGEVVEQVNDILQAVGSQYRL
jgi:hypothetical protein